MNLALKTLLGDGYCDDASAREAMAAQGVVPACTCTPKDAHEAAAIIQLAAQQRLPLVPFGSGTQQGSGRPPQKDFVALSTHRLNTVVHYEPGDMVASVQTGMELGAFQTALVRGLQWLPLDGNPRSTIGGLIATDYSGSLAYGYGTLRDRVLGMTVIHGDGVIRKCGGKVVKNVTGYALEKLYIGSMGTLGLIAEVAFKLQPRPAVRATWSAQISSDHTAGFKLLGAVHAKNLPLERLNLDLRSGAATLQIQAAGTNKELNRIDKDLRAACATAGSSSSAGGFTRTEKETSWNAAAAGVQDAPASAAPAVTLRFWSLNSKLEAIYNAVVAMHRSAVASLGPTGGRIELSGINAETFARIAAAIIALGANYRCENIRGLRIDAPFGPPRPDVALMRKIKESLDPQGIFNAGRFVV